MLRVRSRLLAPLVVVVFVVGIGASVLGGVWITESTKVPVTFTTGEFAGQYNPADIRGSYSLEDIEEAFGIPVDVLARAFGVSVLPDPGEFRASELEETYAVQPDGGEVGTDALRLFVSLYAGLPYVAEDTTRLPAPALGELEPRLAPADVEALRPVLVSLGALRTEVSETASAPESATETAGDTEEHDEDERVIKGRTTFAELLDWGLSRDQIEETLGMPMGARVETVRDFLTAEGLEFAPFRDAFQEMLESTDEP